MNLEIPKEINKKLKIYKIENDFSSIKEVVIYILKETLNEEDELRN